MNSARNGSLDRVVAKLRCPDEEFTPVPFWFLNDEPDRERLAAQLRDFKEKGVDGVVLHPRIGLPRELEYLSGEYFTWIKFLVETAAGLSMKVVLYDEAMYPSGSAHGQVAAAEPSFASVGLTLSRLCGEEIPFPGKVIARLEDGYCLLQRPCGGTIRGIHFGEDDGEADAPASADILNPKAVELFLWLTHEQYYLHLKEYFGTTIIGFFTDEPAVLGRNVRGYAEWTDGLDLEISERGGCLEDLRGLFEGQENDTVRLYRKIIHERLNRVYYARLSGWCQDHGIALMGHPGASDDIDEEIYFQIPGQDLVFRRVSPEAGGIDGMDSVQAKCSADAARHMGRRRNSNECFGVCSREQIPWYMTAQDMKWFIDWLGVRGVNLFIPHAFYYSVRGERSQERPPDVGPHNIWWKHYRLFSDYMKRISWLNTDSRNCARVAVLCASGAVPYREVRVLYENQIEFNYVQEALFDKCFVQNGRLNLGEYEYSWILDPFGLAQRPAFPELEGQVPVKKELTVSAMERDLLTREPCPGLRVTHLIKYGQELYFLVNEGPQEICQEVSLPFQGEICRMDLWSGEQSALPCSNGKRRCCFVLELCAFESCLLIPLVRTKNGMREGIELSLTRPASSPEFEAGAGLTTSRGPGRRITTDGGWRLESQDQERIQKIYTASYTCEKLSGNETLEVSGEEMLELSCNGESAGVSLFPPHRFLLGGHLHSGKNELRLVVTGNIANRYGGSEIPYGLSQEQ